ncbi:MAG TPA: hypothetical protein DD381_11910 [Lentisphaeria bacterium]|nr:MAG: hypothetical protein A2X47_02525 [Lentisphaerae bacterium GWF2_38_69]HBM17031.1 hypothetical protein [Lentisphaeria bacterium]
MDFISPNILWNLIWIIPLLALCAIIAQNKRKKSIRSIIGQRDPEEFINLSKNKRNLKYLLLSISIIFALIAAARPFWGYEILPFFSSGRDVLIVLDTSKSMLSKDISPSRLEHAKMLIKELVSESKGDRFGIIAFSGSAFLECPLTEDKSSLFSVLGELNTSSIPIGGTNIEKALKTAIKAFKAAKGGYKAVVLITDGDELQGNSVSIIDQLKELKIPLLVVGIGDPNIPALIQYKDTQGNDTFLKDSKGEIVKTKLNENSLKDLAAATEGLYVRSTAVNNGLKDVETRIQALIPEKYSSNNTMRPMERFQIPLLLAVILLFFSLSLGERRRKE